MRIETIKAVSERLQEFAPEISPDTHARLMHALRCSEVLEILKAVDLKKIPVAPEDRVAAAGMYSGVAEYVLPNGWTLHVFNDCDEWDYLEAAEAPDGWSVSYGKMPEWLQDWQPESITADDIWGIGP